MAVRHGYGKIAGADALVFAYDTGDTRNSYKGEPTVNLLYSAGAYNLINGATDIYANVTRTDLGNGKYRFVNDGTGGTTVRVYANEADLIDGETYAVSVYYEDLIGTVSIDWCDQAVTGNNSSTEPSGRLTGTSSRSSYTSPFYFLDINLTTGGSVTLYNPQVEHKSHVTPFVAGTRSSTQGLLDLTGNSTIDLANVSFDSNAQMTFDGTSDKIAFPAGLNIPSSGGSIEMVAKRNGTSTNRFLFSKVESGTNRYYLRQPTETTFDVARGNPLSNASFGTINSGTYYHLLMVWENGNLYAYTNGVLNDSTTFTDPGSNLNTVGAYIGAFDGGGSGNVNADIPVAKFYNRALTAAEVKNNYNNYKGRFNI